MKKSGTIFEWLISFRILESYLAHRLACTLITVLLWKAWEKVLFHYNLLDGVRVYAPSCSLYALHVIIACMKQELPFSTSNLIQDYDVWAVLKNWNPKESSFQGLKGNSKCPYIDKTRGITLMCPSTLLVLNSVIGGDKKSSHSSTTQSAPYHVDF